MGAAALGDKKFYGSIKPRTLREIASCAGGSIDVPSLSIDGLASLEEAESTHLSFACDRKYLSALRSTKAAAVIVRSAMQFAVPPTTSAIVVANPYTSFLRVVELFYPPVAILPGIDKTALISGSARIDASVEIGAHVIICDNVTIDSGTQIEPNSFIGTGVAIGRDCRIGPLASLQFARIGSRVVIHAGARIGQRGFSFANEDGRATPVPHLARVLIGDDVEIGANTTIDRGSFRDTTIGDGTKIDNLVQIGHNVRIGCNCLIVAQAGVAGSCDIEDNVRIAGQVAIAPQLRIGHGASIGAQSGIMSDVPSASVMLGTPAFPKREFFRNVAVLKRLARSQRPHSTD